jgi:hypothetical protein
MRAQTTPTPAGLADRTVPLVASAMFAVVLVFSLSVAEFSASESTATSFDVASEDVFFLNDAA